jgi:hypothetical protein
VRGGTSLAHRAKRHAPPAGPRGLAVEQHVLLADQEAGRGGDKPAAVPLEQPADGTAGAVDVEVIDGVVRMTGELERKSMVTAVRPAVRAVDGVIDVIGRLGYAIDDTKRFPQPAEPDEPETPHSPVAARRLT